ncbi:hypothetical protein MKW98_003730 [Papaver atlanticum]|uniref:Uncharacterized protein n=1 Tax=Papaver atlanticum TaxID=357466 RepID=A0AAD4XRY5_9MAGN|nr:hypothetical protein MKW98_003730 [Papaver atlanticum]
MGNDEWSKLTISSIQRHDFATRCDLHGLTIIQEIVEADCENSTSHVSLGLPFKAKAMLKSSSKILKPSAPGPSIHQLWLDPLLPVEENPLNSPKSARRYGDTQLDIFNYRHGMPTLHLLAALMFAPSLVAWLKRIGLGQNLPWS